MKTTEQIIFYQEADAVYEDDRIDYIRVLMMFMKTTKQIIFYQKAGDVYEDERTDYILLGS